MARTPEWQQEVRDSLRKEGWSLRGMSQVVKIVPPGGAVATHLGGYITLGKFLLLKTPQEIENDLGLLPGTLKNGARIYKVCSPSSSLGIRIRPHCRPSGRARVQSGLEHIPWGSAKILQWKLRDGVKIPVDSGNVLDLKPGQQFPHAWLAKP
jgi:hypothetical protein